MGGTATPSGAGSTDFKAENVKLRAENDHLKKLVATLQAELEAIKASTITTEEMNLDLPPFDHEDFAKKDFTVESDGVITGENTSKEPIQKELQSLELVRSENEMKDDAQKNLENISPTKELNPLDSSNINIASNIENTAALNDAILSNIPTASSDSGQSEELSINPSEPTSLPNTTQYMSDTGPSPPSDKLPDANSNLSLGVQSGLPIDPSLPNPSNDGNLANTTNTKDL